jgi:hypothetical protein
MWNHLTSHLEPQIGRPPEGNKIPFKYREANEPYVLFYGRNKAGGLYISVPHWSGHEEWPDHINHLLLPEVGLLEVGANSERIWRAHIWGTSLEASILRFQALFAWGREQTKCLGPLKGYDRLERSLDFDLLENHWMSSCDKHWLVQCLNLPMPDEDSPTTASPKNVVVAGADPRKAS